MQVLFGSASERGYTRRGDRWKKLGVELFFFPHSFLTITINFKKNFNWSKPQKSMSNRPINKLCSLWYFQFFPFRVFVFYSIIHQQCLTCGSSPLNLNNSHRPATVSWLFDLSLGRRKYQDYWVRITAALLYQQQLRTFDNQHLFTAKTRAFALLYCAILLILSSGAKIFSNWKELDLRPRIRITQSLNIKKLQKWVYAFENGRRSQVGKQVGLWLVPNAMRIPFC